MNFYIYSMLELAGWIVYQEIFELHLKYLHFEEQAYSYELTVLVWFDFAVDLAIKTQYRP